MPELPDVENYCSALNRIVCGQGLLKVTLKSPFLLRSVTPPLSDFEGQKLEGVHRESKQLVLTFDSGQRLLIHLMIAGRLRWRPKSRKVPKSNLMVLFEFEEGTLIFTEAGKKKRARLYALEPGKKQLEPFQKGGVEVLDASYKQFDERLRSRNHTLRRALTDQRLFSGIGNAYSDEICFRATLSPLKQTQKLTQEESTRLFDASRKVLAEWCQLLSDEVGDGFPEKVTAFHPKMAVHGRFGEPCLVCGQAVQRIRYASNETNYCPKCQNEGRLLADRSLSRLLKSDWPKTADELEYHMESRRGL